MCRLLKNDQLIVLNFYTIKALKASYLCKTIINNGLRHRQPHLSFRFLTTNKSQSHKHGAQDSLMAQPNPVDPSVELALLKSLYEKNELAEIATIMMKDIVRTADIHQFPVHNNRQDSKTAGELSQGGLVVSCGRSKP